MPLARRCVGCANRAAYSKVTSWRGVGDEGTGEMAIDIAWPAAEFVVDLDDADAEALFDKAAQRHMSMSGHEFLARWDAGEYAGQDWDRHPGLAQVAMLIPFAR